MRFVLNFTETRLTLFLVLGKSEARFQVGLKKSMYVYVNIKFYKSTSGWVLVILQVVHIIMVAISFSFIVHSFF